MEDVTAPEYVEIEIDYDGKVVWVHADGVTVARLCRIGNLTITDHRPRRVREQSRQTEP